METGNIYHDGVVFSLQTTCWGVCRKLPQDRISALTDKAARNGIE